MEVETLKVGTKRCDDHTKQEPTKGRQVLGAGRYRQLTMLA